MVFSSLIFAFVFLPVVISVYYLVCKKSLVAANYVLLAASLFFYGYGEPRFVYVMIASILINYFLARLIDSCKSTKKQLIAKVILWGGVIINLGLLYVCKYLDFSIGIVNRIMHVSIPLRGIVLPIGISFFTFQALSYVIDVYRGTVRVQKNPLFVALYISFFPQLIAGPIVRYSTIEAEITDRSHTVEKFGEGARRFLLGFCKKVILANNLSEVASALTRSDPTTTNPLLLWLGAIAFSLQIFYDFSGYSDMAIGLGKIFGFNFRENFDYPYIAKSITDFWRRWHISLGTWFRDYVYIPLGGSRESAMKVIRNLFIVWLLTGIWHGANFTFLAWGLGYFMLLMIEKYIVRPEIRSSRLLRIVWRIFTLLSVNFGWVMFNASGVMNGISFILGMLGQYHVAPAIDPKLIYFLREFGIFLLLGIIFATPITICAHKKIRQHHGADAVCAVLLPAGYGLAFLWAVSFLILGANNPFIYFNF